MPYDEDHEPRRRPGDCIHFVPRPECRVCPPVERAVTSVACPAPSCGQSVAFGQFRDHVDHAPFAPLFRRREQVRRSRLAMARERGATYPPYVLFPDKVLDKFVLHWPTTSQAFVALFGRDSWDWWGEELLRVLDEQPEPPPDARDLASADVLRYLLSGVDPFTGEVIQADSILADARVTSALRDAVAVLGRREDRPRATNSGRAWSDEDHRALIEGFRSGSSVKDLALRLGRSEHAIESRLVKSGALDSESVRGAMPNAPPRPALR